MKKRSHAPQLRWLLILVLWSAPMGLVSAGTNTLLAEAGDFAREAAMQTYPDGEVSVRMVPLDPRLNLAACEELDLRIPGDRTAGRVSVHARCRAPVNWGIYLTAQVDVVLPVVTLTGPVPRDSVLRPGDMATVETNLATLRDGYLTDPDAAVGMAARHNLRADSVIYQHQLAAPRLVRKGDTVTLATSVGTVTVTTQAVALTDGVYGEQVDVRNPRSDRVVSGWVTGAGTVSMRP
jgi:flagellar basal body P-ring formation protein FlgA